MALFAIGAGIYKIWDVTKNACDLKDTLDAQEDLSYDDEPIRVKKSRKKKKEKSKVKSLRRN